MSDLEPPGLLGAWTLARTIEDRVTGERSRVVGTLTLTDLGADRIQWEEGGRWTRRGGDVVVRRGLWVVRSHGEWEVRFEDDRAFHAWLPGEVVVHPCAPDTYRGLVEGTREHWTITWDVTGPAKDYRMVTSLTR